MNKDTILPLVRHALTCFGGAAVAKGMVSESQLNETVGAVMVLVSVGWFLVEKYRAKKA